MYVGTGDLTSISESNMTYILCATVDGRRPVLKDVIVYLNEL